MKKYPCEACGTREQSSRHHILPRIHFCGDGRIAYLCVPCHRGVERKIQIAECKASGSSKARFKLEKEQYVQILFEFITEKKNESFWQDNLFYA
jgi:hypothetical protein